MSISMNLSDIIARVKNIVDSVRCAVCDKTDGSRIRFPCGHTSCDECLIGSEECMLCLTPPTFLDKPKSDETLSQRVKHACDLLYACQDTFNLDVYRRLRVSEQLRAEKELFPECIQAPAKYCNKRKSITTIGNKENIHHSFHPGEHISHTNLFKMNKSNNYVQQWLDNSETYPRNALADLNVNKQNKLNKKKAVKSHVLRDTHATQRKRLHSSTSFSLIGQENNLELKVKKSKKSVSKSHLHVDNDKKLFELTNNDESGIVIDDEPILIDDSQSQNIDKDELALLAVQAADQERSDFKSLELETSQDIKLLPPVTTQLKQVNDDKIKKVPFYKKSAMAECCFYCMVDYKPNINLNKDNEKSASDNVSITIENKHFVTTINISKCADAISSKKSVLVQTNLNQTEKTPDNKNTYGTIQEKNNELVLADTRMDTAESLDPSQSPVDNILVLKNDTGKKGITIDDSDSDESCLGGSFLQVTAEVHRSSEPLDYGILNEINPSELPTRSKNKVRCITPDSNNSSDKENCDPNKRKKQNNGKKDKYLKK